MPDLPASTPPSDISVTSVAIATYRSRDVIASARLEGRLAVIDGCVMLKSDDKPDGTLVFFPEGQVRWNDGTRLLRIGIDTFRIGEKVAITGGLSLLSNFADRARMPPSCARTSGFFSGANATRIR